MKTNKKILAVLSLTTVISLSGAALAQASFWDKAASLLKESTTAKSETSTDTSANAKALAALSNTDVEKGLKQALTTGTERVVKQLSAKGGFSADPKIHIPLPHVLQKADQALTAIGMGALTEDLETRINAAAEAATPKAKEIFVASIKKMTLDDAKEILTGPEDAATAYLKKTMGPELATAMEPIITSAMAQAGVVKSYDAVMGQYGQIPFMPDVKANLNGYVTQKAMDGVFYYVAKEEAAIRANPAQWTTSLMKKVFSAAK